MKYTLLGKLLTNSLDTYFTEYLAKNSLENNLSVIELLKAGTNQQTSTLVIPTPDLNTGQSRAYCEKGLPRFLYTIPFTKTIFDELLEGKHPFGPDSINITDISNGNQTVQIQSPIQASNPTQIFPIP